jgi:hypothetical protein
MSTWRIAAVVTLLAACSQGQGAVSVRWRIIDKTSGAVSDPRDYANPTTGGCQCIGGQGANCQNSCGWTVNRVRLHVSTLTSTGLQESVPPIEFPCRQEEATTASIIPVGMLFFSVEGDTGSTDAGLKIQAYGPPGVLRNVVAAQVVNLDVVELAPISTEPPVLSGDAGATPVGVDLGCGQQ